MRVQFFRDGVDHVLRTGAPVDGNNAPVLDLLAEAVHAFPNASFEHLHTLIDAREADLAYPAPNYTQDLERFAVDTQGTLIGVHASILSSKMEKSQLTTASEMAGRAVGLSILLRAAPAHAVSRLSYMPRRRADEIGVSQSDMLAGTGNACAVFEEVASQAIDCLETAEKHLQQVPHVARPAFWPLSMARIYLSRLKKARFNPFDDRLQRSLQQTYPLALQTRLLLRRLLRT